MVIRAKLYKDPMVIVGVVFRAKLYKDPMVFVGGDYMVNRLGIYLAVTMRRLWIQDSYSVDKLITLFVLGYLATVKYMLYRIKLHMARV